MIARFDSFSNYDEPLFYLCSPGCRYENGKLTSVAGVLTAISDEEIQFNFNAESELSFRAYRVTSTNKLEQEYINKLYRTLQNKRLIFVDDVGFFVVTNVQEGWSEGQQYKDVTATSVEYELENKTVPSLLSSSDASDAEVTIGFHDLLIKLVGSSGIASGWAIGHIDPAINSRYRTFSDVSEDENILNFMISDMQDAYECIFVFDTINRIVNVYDAETYLKETSIHITRDDLIDSMDITENCDDLYTAISVSGADDLSINAINPLGTRVIYNFDYYLDWMSDELAAKVTAWQELLEEKFEENYNLSVQYYEDLQTKNDASYELERLNTCLKQYNRCYENIVAEDGLDEVASYNSVIGEEGGELIPEDATKEAVLKKIKSLVDSTNASITKQQTTYNNIQKQITAEEAKIAAIHTECAMNKNFTSDELAELNEYIDEGNYTDEYITVTDSMSYTERFAQMKILYDRAKVQLTKISGPTQEYNVDVESFVFVKDFLPFTEQIETGCLINVELDQDDVAELFLSTMTVNYDEKSMSLTFGNRYNKYDQKSLYEDALGDIKRTANTVSYLKDVVQPLEDGTLSKMATDIASSRDLAKSSVLASENQDIMIDDTGYTGRKVVDGVADPEQIKINHQNIVFTDDSWESAKLAIGKISVPSGGTKYGINAEVVMGDMIIGNGLDITSGSNSGTTGFVIDSKGVHVNYNGTETITLDASSGKMTATDVDLKGNIKATSGYIGSDSYHFNIGGNTTKAWMYSGTTSMDDKTNNGIYVGTDGINLGKGAFKVTNTGALTATSATVTGEINATSGTIGSTNYHFNIGGNTTKAWMYSGTSSIDDKTNNGIYIGTDGINLGKSVFKVTNTGVLTATSATITGTINASSGVIGSGLKLTIGGDTNRAWIYYGVTSASDTAHDGVYLGTDGICLGKGVFKVDTAGALTATSATITGDIHATSGQIGATSYHFNIGGADWGDNPRAWIYYGKSDKSQGTDHPGMYIGTDGINLWDKIIMSKDGSAEFKGSVHAGKIICNGTELDPDTMSGTYITNNTIYGATKIANGSVSSGTGGNLDSTGQSGIDGGLIVKSCLSGTHVENWYCDRIVVGQDGFSGGVSIVSKTGVVYRVLGYELGGSGS